MKCQPLFWKDRCDIVHTADEATAEQRYRSELITFFQDIRNKQWQFAASDRWLLDKNISFFEKSDYTSIDLWRRQVEAAMQTARFQAAQITPDIRKYLEVVEVVGDCPRKKHSSRRKQRLVPTQVLYRQLSLFELMKSSEKKYDDAEQLRRQSRGRTQTNRISDMGYVGRPDNAGGVVVRNGIERYKHRRRKADVKVCNNLISYFSTKHEGERPHPAVPHVVGTRKIKY